MELKQSSKRENGLYLQPKGYDYQEIGGMIITAIAILGVAKLFNLI